MQIYKVVLTGGPCAGKTTILKEVNKYLKKENIPFVTIPETATELIINGITPNSMKAYDFQKKVIKSQLNKEREAEDYLNNHFANQDKCVIIYDRGIYDNAAYLNAIDFQKLLFDTNLMGISILDSYDMILDLLSVAVCKKEAYNLSNEARSETIQEAAIIDNKTSNAWANHYNLKLLSSKNTVEEQTQTVINYINNLFDGVENQIKTKFLIDESNSDLSIYNNIESLHVNEYYFDTELPKDYNFVISTKHKYDSSYILEIYQEKNNQKVIVYNKNINYNTFNYICQKYQIIKKINKKEINFIDNQTFYKISIYSDKAFIEIQNNTLSDEIIIPDNIKILDNNQITISNTNDITNYVKKLIK